MKRYLPKPLLISLAFSVSPLATTPAPTDTLERSVSLMAKIGWCGSPSFSPDGKRLAFVSNLTGIPQIWTVDSQGGWPEQVTALDDPIGRVSWSPDGQWLAFGLSPGGGMNTQIYIVRPDGTEMRRLTDGGKEGNSLGDWTLDSRFLTMSSNRRSSSSIDAYLLDVRTGEHKLVAENPGIGFLTDLSHDQRYGLLSRTKSRGDNDLYLVDLSTSAETLLTPHDEPSNFGGAMSPDGRSLYISGNENRDLFALGLVRLGEDGRPGPTKIIAERDDGELEIIILTEDGSQAVLRWNIAGRTEISFIDLRTLKVRVGPQLPGEIAGSFVYSRDGRYLAMTVSGAATPQDIWILDTETDSFHRVTRSPHPGVDLAGLIRPELVRFPAHDGLELSGWLYLAQGVKQPGAMVLSFHGGPEGQERPRFRSDYQALLSQGISVFAPNVRGSSGFGKKFVNLDNGELRFDGVRDIEACVKYVVDRGVADPKRIGILGGSYGGYMVMAGLADYPDLFAAGANLFGVVNFETFFAHTEPWMAAISTIEYGDPVTQKDLLRRLSPIHRVDQVKAPTIVLHGANDTNVPVVEAEQVVESLKKRGIPVEYILFPDEGHGWRKTPNRIRSTVAIVQWFSEYLAAR